MDLGSARGSVCSCCELQQYRKIEETVRQYAAHRSKAVEPSKRWCLGLQIGRLVTGSHVPGKWMVAEFIPDSVRALGWRMRLAYASAMSVGCIDDRSV